MRERERAMSIPVAMRAEPDIPIVRAPAFGSEPDPVPAEFHEIALETSRNRVWPLFLAVGIGLVVGFAGGYGVATRDKLMQIGFGAADPPVQAVPAQTAPAVVAAAPVAMPPAAAAPPTPTPVSEPTSAASESPGAAANLAAETGRIVVRSTPEGAHVSVDGHDAGTTPATVRDIARGSHTVRVTRDGYVADERKVAITTARPSQTLTVDLARSAVTAEAAAPSAARGGIVSGGPGGLTVDSRPEGASVFVDGRMVGTTPLTIDSVAAGEHSIGLTREGYSRWASSVRVTTGERARVTASLEK
jgi:hypothetical protein